MTDRKLTCSVNLLLNADIGEEADGAMTIRLSNARFATIGYAETVEKVPPLNEETKDVMTNGVIKLGLQALLDKLNGEHNEAAPIPTQPGGDA